MDDAAVASALGERGGRLQYQLGMGSGDLGMHPADADARCDLVDTLMMTFGGGTLSLPMVQWLAACACRAGAVHSDLNRLRDLGSGGGLYPDDMRRNIFRHCIPSIIISFSSTLQLKIVCSHYYSSIYTISNTRIAYSKNPTSICINL